MAGIMVKLRAWQVPNFASLEQPPSKREDGIRPDISLAIADLDNSALDELVAEWLHGVYAKAGKQSPWRNQG